MMWLTDRTLTDTSSFCSTQGDCTFDMELNSVKVLTPARAAGTVVLLRDGEQGLEVFMVRRHSASDVLGGAYVFPGGKVDELDASPDLAALLDQPSEQLRKLLNEPDLTVSAAAALYVAAMREAFEECGILFAGRTDASWATATDKLALQAAPFGLALAAAGLSLRTLDMQPWSRWITPLIPSVSTKRFDTRFFVAQLPPDQVALHDNLEATESAWLTPRSALHQYWAGEMALAPPQIMSLSHLSRYRNAQEVLQAARASPPPVVFPQPQDVDGQRVICYPGDPGHTVTTRALPGPTRLVYRNRRFEPLGGFDALFN